MAVKVQFEIGHTSKLRSKKTPEGFTHDWELYVKGIDKAEIHIYIEKVVFNLHASFSKPKRAIKEPPYIIHECGYAGFMLPIDIYFRNRDEPKRVQFAYDLDLQQTGPPHHRYEVKKFIFENPSEEFRQKLIKGGGVPVAGIVGGIQTSLNPTNNQVSSTSVADLYPKAIKDSEELNKLNKVKMSSNEVKKPKSRLSDETKVNTFTNLFGTPIQNKNSPESRSSVDSFKKSNFSTNNEKVSSREKESFEKGREKPDKKDKQKSSSYKNLQNNYYKSVTSNSKIDKHNESVREKKYKSSDKERTHEREKEDNSNNRGVSGKRTPSPKKSVSTSTKIVDDNNSSKNVGGEKSKKSNQSYSIGKKAKKDKKDKDRRKEKTDKEQKYTNENTGDSTASKDLYIKQERSTKNIDEPFINKSSYTLDGSNNSVARREETEEKKVFDSNKKKFANDKVISKKIGADEIKSKDGKYTHKHKKKSKNKDIDRDLENIKKEKTIERKNEIINKNISPSSTDTHTSSTNKMSFVNDIEKKTSKDKTQSNKESKSKLKSGSKLKDEKPVSLSLSDKKEKSSISSLPLSVSTNVKSNQDSIESDLSTQPNKKSSALTFSSLTNSAHISDESSNSSFPDIVHKNVNKSSKNEPSNNVQQGEKHSRDDKKRRSNNLYSKHEFMEPSVKHIKREHSTKSPDNNTHFSSETALITPVSAVSQGLQFVNNGFSIGIPAEYLNELQDLHQKIMTLQDNEELQQVVEMIATTGCFEITTRTFDFDLCKLDRSTVQRLQEFLAPT